MSCEEESRDKDKDSRYESSPLSSWIYVSRSPTKCRDKGKKVKRFLAEAQKYKITGIIRCSIYKEQNTIEVF
jgi:hypothetical protein